MAKNFGNGVLYVSEQMHAMTLAQMILDDLAEADEIFVCLMGTDDLPQKLDVLRRLLNEQGFDFYVSPVSTEGEEPSETFDLIVRKDDSVKPKVKAKTVVKRVLEFPPEYKQAGIAVLNYFGEVVSKKYPDLDVSIAIEQHGKIVTLVINTPNGERERIEKDLENYILVVRGEISPEEYIGNPINALALKQALQRASLQIEQTKELMYTERKHYEARISTLERNDQNQQQYIEQLGSLLIQNRSTQAELIDIP